MANLLEVKNLTTQFFTSAGTVQAVDDVSFDVDEGETVAVVGESGCGKSVSALSILRLIPWPPGKIVGGSIHFAGRDLLALSDEEIRKIRGREISMVVSGADDLTEPGTVDWTPADRDDGASPGDLE
tara:strand:- start:91 stop:471 length:381 start_codon:yes stop_codon:yes gene_type:complete